MGRSAAKADPASAIAPTEAKRIRRYMVLFSLTRVANEPKLLRFIRPQKQAEAEMGISKAEFPALWLQCNG